MVLGVVVSLFEAGFWPRAMPTSSKNAHHFMCHLDGRFLLDVGEGDKTRMPRSPGLDRGTTHCGEATRVRRKLPLAELPEQG